MPVVRVFGASLGQRNKAGILQDEKKTRGRSKQRWAGNGKPTNGLGAERLGWDEEAAWRARVCRARGSGF